MKEAAELEKELGKECIVCNGARSIPTGVCHCGASMDDLNAYRAHDNHTPVEIVIPCFRCKRRAQEGKRQ